MSKKEVKRTPELRFKGFTDDWEQVKLKNLGDTKSGVGFPSKEQGGSEGIPFYKVSDMNNPKNIRIMKMANNYVSNEQIKNNKWNIHESVPAIIFAQRGAAIMLERKQLCLSPFLIDNNMMAYFLDKSWDLSFAFATFNKLQLKSLTQLGSLPSFTAKDVGEIKIKRPTCMKEQNRVGTFLEIIDNTIDDQEKKIQDLKLLKQGYVKLLYPLYKQYFPLLRFKDFNKSWELHLASDIFSTVSDKHHPMLPVLTATQTKGMIYKELEQINSTTDLDNYKRVLPGQFVIHLRSFQGGFAYSNIEGLTSPAYTVLKLKQLDKMNPEFWKFIFSSSLFINRLELITYGIRDGRSINAKDFLNFKFNTPSKLEQDKIVDLLNELTSLISNQESKLTQIKNIKQAYLQKLFV